MKWVLYFSFLLLSVSVFSQNDALAQQYFNEGKFEKALSLFEKLYSGHPENPGYYKSLVECYQQLEKFDAAEELIRTKIDSIHGNGVRITSPAYLVDLGYNYILRGEKGQGEKYYQLAIDRIEENPSFAYVVGGKLKENSALEFAVKAYKKGMELNPELTFNYNLAFIYGEMGEMENMYNTYLDLILSRDSFKSSVQRNIGRFISEEASSENNQLLKKLLLKRTQSDPNVIWNELLSWLFIQQKQFNSAFLQEKAILKRSLEPSVQRIINLGLIAQNEGNDETATEVYKYIIANFNDRSLQLFCNLHLLEIEVKRVKEKDLNDIRERYQQLMDEYGFFPETLDLQIAFAEFLAFHAGDTGSAEKLVKKGLETQLSRMDEARLKMTLGDILVYDEKFNQALIYYSQVQKMVKNDVLAQDARFKVARTSFYKGDFDWAESQLKVLKASTTQLIANDALQLKLLISDNSLEDSTQTALKLYAKAELKDFQNKKDEAITLLDSILKNHRGESIEDEALYKQAGLYKEKELYDKARMNYVKIIEFFPHDILADDAIYALAELYLNRLNEPEKARELYERIVFDHADSVYFVEARKKFRKLRGDPVN